MSALHSVHVDRLAALEAGSDARREAAEYLAAIVDDNFRDGTADLYVIFGGVGDSDEEWDAREGVTVHAGRKREHIRTALGQPLVTIDYVRDEGGLR